MKMQSCLIIRCIALNTINLQELLYKLENHTKKQFPQAVITLTLNEPYWKYPECNEIIYQLFNNQFITVTKWINHLTLTWHYIKSDNEEEVIWSQLCHPEEEFLMPEISWVHIYTWEENEEPVIN